MPDRDVRGECFAWAWKTQRKRGDVLVHGTVNDPWSAEAYQHAWLERDDRVYDWQSVVVGLGPGPKGWAKDRFYETYRPKNLVTYDYYEARAKAARFGHYGPW